MAFSLEENVFDFAPTILYALYDSLCLGRRYDPIFRPLKNLCNGRGSLRHDTIRAEITY